MVQYSEIVTSLWTDVGKELRVLGSIRQVRRAEWSKALGSRLLVVLLSGYGGVLVARPELLG